MTHDDLTAMLRNLPTPSVGGVPLGGIHQMAADRLDRYRETLIEARRQMDEMAEVLWASPGEGKGWLGTGFIGEALK
jgi:hypothetical protein